jgi:diacylglycerol kinase (ATP)
MKSLYGIWVFTNAGNHSLRLFSWHIVMRMQSPKGSPCDPIAPPDLPHSLRAFRRVPKTDPQDMVTMLTFSIS